MSDEQTIEGGTNKPVAPQPAAGSQQPATTNEKQATEMEVQKHPHHVMHKKKWPEYLLEFLMIFLAVFLGFEAENIRERSVERHRERQYIFSLVEDLKDDVKHLEHQIALQKSSIVMMDSFSTILTRPEMIAKSGDQLYFFGRLSPRLHTFSANMRTFEQLKNSGSFRLISRTETSNKIMAYYEKIPVIQQMEVIFAAEFTDYKKLAAQIFEPSVFLKQQTESNDVLRTTDNPPLQNANPALLKQLAIYVIYMNGSRKTILVNDGNLVKAAKELIDYLQKEYHLSQ